MVYQARLESVCSRKVTVGSNPTLSAKNFFDLPMKTLAELLSESSLRDLATPSDYLLGKEISRQGGVEIVKIGRYEATARSKAPGGQKRTVSLTATKTGLKCGCT